MKNISDDFKTVLEHECIIDRYLKTGFLDRNDAIEKYKKFNDTHKEYLLRVNIEGAILHNTTQMENLSDFDIIYNLQLQLKYLGGKNLLEGLQNG